MKMIDKNISTQTKKIIRKTGGGNEWVDIPGAEGSKPVLTDEQILELSELIVKIENHYGFPCDIEWAMDDEGKIFITQSRPITTLKQSVTSDLNNAVENIPAKEEFFDKQISLTEWFGNMGHDDVEKHRVEDNEKRERLSVLNEIIGIPFDRPTKFEAVDVAGRTVAFQEFINKHGQEKCALRLIPKVKGIKKLRMRGKTIDEVTSGWFKDLDINLEDYRADFVPHADVTYWSTIFTVSASGVRGEIIADSHEKLTQGFHGENSPISFAYDFEAEVWQLEPENAEAQKHLVTILEYLKVSEDKQNELKEKLDSTFSAGYLNGYFETADTDQAFWFIDYNRLLGDSMPKLVKVKPDTAGDLFGQCASSGKAKGKVSVVSDPSEYFSEGSILVCDMTSPNFLPLMQKAGAVVTNRGGVTCHAAIAARELGVPCVIGTETATEVLKDGDLVEVDADEGVVKILKKIDGSMEV